MHCSETTNLTLTDMIYTETVYLIGGANNPYRTFIEAWNFAKPGDPIHKAIVSYSLNASEDRERAHACQLGVYFHTFLKRVLDGEFQHKYTYHPVKQWVKNIKK